jgi:hypothetical protein
MYTPPRPEGEGLTPAAGSGTMVPMFESSFSLGENPQAGVAN